MRAALALLCAFVLLASPAEAQISLLGLRNSLVQFALSRISVPGSLEITAEGVEEAEDGRTELVGVRVADSQGVWLEVDGIGLSWNARRILLAELDITRLSARGVRVLRRPVPADVAVERTAEPPPRERFAWPRAPIATQVRELSLTGVEVAGGVISTQPIAFDATGSARDEGAEQAVTLTLDRTDAVQGRIALDYLRDFSAGTLRLDLDADEAVGGLVAEIAGLPETSASRLSLQADGPLANWRVSLDAEADRVLTARGQGSIDLGPPFALDVGLTVTPGDRLEPRLAALLAPQARLVARAREGADGVIVIEEGALTAPELDIAVDGRFTRQTGALAGTARLEARAGLAALTPGLAFGRLGFDGSVSGTLDALAADGTLSLEGLETEPVDVAAARLDARLTRTGPRIGLTLSGEAQRLRLDRVGPDLLGRAALALDGAWEGGTLELARLTLDAPLLNVAASGQASPAQDSAALDYSVSTPDLAPIAGAYGADAGGRLAMNGRLDGTLSAPRLVGEIALEDIAWQGEGFGRLALSHDMTLGPAPSGRVALRSEGADFGPAEIATDLALSDGRLALTGLAAEVLGITADGAVTVDLSTMLADGAVDARIADLAPLARFLETEVTGSAEGRIGLAAADGRQDIALRLEGAGLNAGEARLALLDLDATVRDALGNPSVDGRLTARDAAGFGFAAASLDIEGAGTDLRGSGGADLRFAMTGLSGPDGLALEDARGTVRGVSLLDAPAATASIVATDMRGFGAALNRLDLDLVGTDLAGEGRAALRFEANRLGVAEASLDRAAGTASLAGLFGSPTGHARLRFDGVEAGGARIPRAEASASLNGRGAARDAALVLSVPRTDLDGGRLGALDAEARLDDAFGQAPTLDARVRLAASRLGDTALDTARVTAAGPLGALALAVDAAGTADTKPLSVRLRGQADAADTAALSLRLTEARATWDTAEASLRRPARIALGPSLAVQGLDLAIPGGALTADVTPENGGYLARLGLDLADVGPLAELGDLPLSGGRLDLDGRLDTRAGRTDARATLTARDLTLTDEPLGGGGLDLDGSARWTGRRAEASLALSGDFGEPMLIEATLPVVAQPGGLPTVPAGGALGGSLRWKGRIGDLWALVPAADHVLDGNADIDLRLSGTLAAPGFGGRVSLTDGTYQNLEIGTILTDLTVDSTVEADGSFDLSATADDGSGGRISARAELLRGRLDATLGTEGAILVRRDDATAQISLDIRANGPITAPAISGRVGIDRAEVRLVNATPPSVPDLGPVRIKGAPPPEEDGELGGGIALDIAVQAPRNVFVRGRGLDSEWKIDLSVAGNAAEPAITGAIEKVRGTLNLVGYPFDLETGAIRFTGGQPVDPTLDIGLTRESNGVIGGLFVTGTASDPEIGFRSNPSLPEEEVLPRVMFGQSRQALSPPQALQLALGLAALLDGTGGPLDAVRATTGLDVLRIEDDGEEGAQVTVGRNVAEGVFVGAKQPLDGGPAKVTVEVEVFGEITVDTEVGTEQGSSVGLNWRRNF